MSQTAISYGTAAWLASLIETGWQLSVGEHFEPGEHVVLRLVEDEFTPLELVRPDTRTVGVLACRDTDGVFVPTSSKAAAVALLDRAYREMEDSA